MAFIFCIGDQDILTVGWTDLVCRKKHGYYMYIRQLTSNFNFGSTGNYNGDLWKYADLLLGLAMAPLLEWMLKASYNRVYKMEAYYFISECLASLLDITPVMLSQKWRLKYVMHIKLQ
ncbi:hypothetical protein [Legionella longbeachae]|uniref:hypothetical protein n=1 Tax=Legionella longbeachae TaxID=450 RepID=UPI001248F2B2|nr:hypothetical protein [Legionella longbeachae]QEY51604.1 hypothetical protein FQU71_10300 [Legionella longbeachae]